MNRKIKNDQYEVFITFKNANCFSIAAQFLPTNENFSNDSVELMRINKDTVLAALEKKSEKNLRCEFEQLFEDGKKVLQIVFIVNFDYLPEFREQIRLDYIEQSEGLKKLNLVNIQTEVQELSTALDSLQKNGSTTHTEIPTFYVGPDKKEVWTKEINRGKYILRLSGTINNSSTGATDKLTFYLNTPGEKENKMLVFRNHFQASYHYPFFMSQVIDCSQGQLKVLANSTMANGTIMTLNFVLNRVTEVN